MKKITNIKGITLIALVITIIVLLILAGVTVATLTGENGLLGKAATAGQRNKEAEDDEKNKLSSYEQEIDKYKTWERTGGEGGSVNYCTTPATSLTTSTASSAAPCVVVESYRSGTEWCRVWSDGWIEQGGKSTGGGDATGRTTTFIKEFQNTDYTITTSDTISTHTDQASCALVVTSKTTTGFNISSSWVTNNGWSWSTLDFNWYACGY